MNEFHPSIFVLDTNVFVEAHRRYYAMDLCPGFWQCLEHFCKEPRLVSIDRVRDEITEGDPLDEWVRRAPDQLFASTADWAVARAFRDMMSWVQNSVQFRPEAKAEFARVADGWIVAYAKVKGFSVVTQELLDPQRQEKGPNPQRMQRVWRTVQRHLFDAAVLGSFFRLAAIGLGGLMPVQELRTDSSRPRWFSPPTIATFP